MRKNVFATGLVLAAVLGMASGPRAWAKPADLPVDEQIHCPEGVDKGPGSITIGMDLQADRISVRVEVGKTETLALLDTVTPSLVTAYLEETLQQFSEHVQWKVGVLLSQVVPAGWRVPNLSASVTFEESEPAPAASAREQQAVQCFKIAESCRRSGQYDKARSCYQQVHLLMPTSRVGQLAIDRLMEIEDRMRDGAEEAETPAQDKDREESHRDIRQRAIPLGLVEVSY